MSQKLEAQYMSPAQCTFLAELYDRFNKILINNHSKFLQSIYEVWFTWWPECNVYPVDPEVFFLGEEQLACAIALTLPDVLEITWTCIPSNRCSHCQQDPPFDSHLTVNPQHNGSTNKFFAQWPVHKAYYPDVDDEDELTEKQKEQIMSWYQWQTNPTHLTCLGGSRGVLNIKQTLIGGVSMKGPHALKEVEVHSQMYYANHVKQSADNAIADSGITSCGSKLHMC
ncbi:uncharacterized protein BJ212DRAFT_1303045 [Suillus subaureus]|uniref:Uncharacterized protein n=1 Tax=Suillus subaureus TaxID=48587 RepID=A0A9P7J8S1_9AGAM|nr:uncharacterized protein BJ212DRAFT_1303045 [Suillus subaureus]KAG1808437.1 hypothetical protein BJ212DRAFT_1303045 [Suillus subaureus]